MRKFYVLVLLLMGVALSAQPTVRGKITLKSPAHDRDFIVRHTKVVLLTKNSRDTVSINDRLEFEFPTATAGTGFLYLSSPVLPRNTEYKFRVKKRKPTSVSLEYDRFQAEPARSMKSPEEREDDLVKGLIIARLAVDFLGLIQCLQR